MDPMRPDFVLFINSLRNSFLDPIVIEFFSSSYLALCGRTFSTQSYGVSEMNVSKKILKSFPFRESDTRTEFPKRKRKRKNIFKSWFYTLNRFNPDQPGLKFRYGPDVRSSPVREL